MDPNAKQQVAEKLRNSGSVLVTVSQNPSVDQLSAAVGLSLMLSKLNKHAITVFSGQIPNTMEFLDPEKVIDSSVDGLRDFIISISKDKADKLRYKVEDDVVKIFITPYQGKIDENDLSYSQGDFNVDAVVALGVLKREELDAAITAQGRILHDATIMTITAGDQGAGTLGSVNWNDPAASSVSEMLVSISEALQGNILDGPMATAFLTGIVSATDRFSNDKTTPKVMTMSAQLMAAGANQQLIATNLQIHGPEPEEKHEIEAEPAAVEITEDGQLKTESTQIPHDEPRKDDKPSKPDSDDGPPETDASNEEDKDPVAAIKEDVKADDKLSLQQIEKQLHAHEDELSSHDSIKVEKPEKPKHEPEDPAIQALEDKIDHDPAESMKTLEQTIHPDERSYQTPPAPTPAPLPPSPAPLPPSQTSSRVALNADSPAQDTPSFASKPVFGTDDSTDQPALDFQPPDIPTMTHRSGQIGDVKGQGPTPTFDEKPTLGGTFNATSDQAHQEELKKMQDGQNRSILSHNGEPQQQAQQAQPTPTMPAVPQPQSPDMIDQARKAVEAAMISGPSVPEPQQSLNAQPMPTGNDISGQIHIDDRGVMGAPPMPVAPPPIQAQAPGVPPPLPPNPQIGAPSMQAPPMPAAPPPAPAAPPPLPQSPAPGEGPSNVGQMFIPPPPAGGQAPPPPANPFNQPNSNYPFQ